MQQPIGIRKQYVSVSQDEILAALRETGGGEVPTIAEHFDISEDQAKSKVEGLVYQGKLERLGEPGKRAYYRVRA